ncbi:MAG: hypothetical protein WD847_08335 [Pirellulales bacterium]
MSRLVRSEWDSSRYGRLLGNRQVLEALQAGASVDQLQALYQAELDAFRARRQSFLMYPE